VGVVGVGWERHTQRRRGPGHRDGRRVGFEQKQGRGSEKG